MTSIPQCERGPEARIDNYSSLIFRVAFLAALLAVAPHVLAATPSCEAQAISSHDVLRAETLANWEPVDDRTVLIWMEHSARARLVRLSRPLEGLASAPIIMLVDGDGDRTISACGHDALTLSYDEREKVRIVSIERLSERLTAALDAGEAGEAASNVTLSRT